MNNTDTSLYAFAIHPQDVARLWPALVADVERALEEQMLGQTTSADVERMAREGAVQLVCMQRGEERVATMALELIDVPSVDGENMTACNVITIAGTDMAAWAEEMVEVLEAVAREQGADIIVWKGRPGWQRFMRRWDYVPAYTIMTKRLKA